MTAWESIKEFYKTQFGIEGWVVELYANMDILVLCASGASNKSISTLVQLDLDDVVEVLMNTFGFPGWTEDLIVNPYKIYNELSIKLGEEGQEYLKNTFLFCISDLSRFVTDLEEVYNMCKTMQEIEERIADEWI